MGKGRIIGFAILALGATALPLGDAAAEVHLTGGSGSNYRISVKSWWEIPFRSVVRQQFDFSCGSAAVATLLTYHYGRQVPERAVFSQMWERGDQAVIRRSGFSMLDMKKYLDGVGLRADGFRLTAEQLARESRPGIVLLDLNGYKHFVVLKGVRNGRVLVGDPMIGLSDYSLADFARIWNGIILAVVRPGDGAQPKFNLAGDWGPWSTAPLESGALRASVGSLTTYLPPDYQLTSQMIYDMQSGTLTR